MVKGDKGLAGVEWRDFWCKDVGLAVFCPFNISTMLDGGRVCALRSQQRKLEIGSLFSPFPIIVRPLELDPT